MKNNIEIYYFASEV